MNGRTALPALMRKLLAATFLLLVAGSAPLAADRAPVPPPGPGDRCAVCGMFVAPFPTWIAAIRQADGKVLYFDGPREMFAMLFSLKKEGAKGEGYVTDYYTAKLIPVENAWFVAGSDQIGPMGRDLVPLESQKAAEGFKLDHGGRAVYPFTGVTEEVVKAME